MAHRDRKTRKMRGSRTHGYGNTQKHRGAGSRGGHGMAGSKKHRWHYVSKHLPGYFGEKGFKRHSADKEPEKTINVGHLTRNIEKLVKEGVATESNGTYNVDLTSAGYGKLLGAGEVKVKLNITVAKSSAQAKDKVEAAGGNVKTFDAEANEHTEKPGD